MRTHSSFPTQEVLALRETLARGVVDEAMLVLARAQRKMGSLQMQEARLPQPQAQPRPQAQPTPRAEGLDRSLLQDLDRFCTLLADQPPSALGAISHVGERGAPGSKRTGTGPEEVVRGWSWD